MPDSSILADELTAAVAAGRFQIHQLPLPLMSEPLSMSLTDRLIEEGVETGDIVRIRERSLRLGITASLRLGMNPEMAGGFALMFAAMALREQLDRHEALPEWDPEVTTCRISDGATSTPVTTLHPTGSYL
jgi:hypothetical protein